MVRRGHSCSLFLLSVSDKRPGVKYTLNYSFCKFFLFLIDLASYCFVNMKTGCMCLRSVEKIILEAPGHGHT